MKASITCLITLNTWSYSRKHKTIAVFSGASMIACSLGLIAPIVLMDDKFIAFIYPTKIIKISNSKYALSSELYSLLITDPKLS